MATIDSLDIQIAGSAQKANQAIDSLIKNLGNLATALKIDTSGFEKIGKSLNLSEIGKSVKSANAEMQKISKSATEVAKEFQNKFKDIDVKVDFSKPEAELRKFQKQAQFAENSLSRVMASSSADKRVGEIEKWSISLAQATNAVKILENHMEGLQTAQPKLDFDTDKIQETGKTLAYFQETVKEIQDFVSRGIKVPDIYIENVKEELEELKNTFPQATGEISEFENKLHELQTISTRLKKETIEPKFDTSEINKIDIAKEKTKDFESVLNSLKNITPQINETNLNKLQNRLKSIESKTENLRYELEKGLRFGTIDVNDKAFNRLTIKIKESENQAELLREKIKQVQQASTQTSSGAKKLGDSVKSASKSFSSLASSSAKAIKPLNNLGNSFKSLLRTILPILGIRQLFNWGKQAMEISSDLTEVQNVVDTTFGNMAYKVEEFAETSIEKFGMSELALKQISSRFQAMGTAMGFPIDRMSDMSVELTGLAADMASFYNVSQEDVAKSLESIFTGTTRPMRQYGIDLTQATLQEWALKQGMDANIQSMSQAEKTMLRYQYVMANTGAAQGDFARTMNSWANQVRILKMNFQQLASIIGGVLVNAFKPVVKAINAAMSHIIAFAKTISNALGQIFGWKYEESGGGITQDFEDAADASDGMASGTGETLDNLKKMQKYIAPWHEVNNMTTDSGDSGAGGGAGGSGIGGGAGVGSGDGWVKGDSILKAFQSEIDTLYKLGKHISDTLSDVMESIKWDKVYEKARNFGKGLAEFLNGLINPRLFGNVGKTIAGALNTVVYSALSFGLTFDFVNLGESIAEGVNQFFATFDFASLAETINVWVQGIWNTIKTAISKIKWGNVWDGAKEFLNNIDLETVAIAIGALTIKKILGLHLASSALSFIGTTLSRKIAQSIASKLGVEIAANAGIRTALKTGLSKAFSGISGKGILDIGTVLGAGTLAEKFAFISKMLGGIGLVIGGIITAVKGFFDMWENGWGIVGEIIKDIGIALTAIGAVILGVAATPAIIVAAIVAAVSTIAIVVHDNWKLVSGFFSDLWDSIASVWSKAVTWFSDSVITPIVNFFSGFATRVGQIFEGLWIIIQAVWKVASTWFNDNVIRPIVGVFSPIVESISGFFSQAWEDIKSVWAYVSGWFSRNIIEPVSNAFKDACDAIGGFFSGLWRGIKKGVAGAMNAVIGAIEGAINGIVYGINAAIGGFNKIVSWAADVIGANWGGVDLLSNVSLGRITVTGYSTGGFPEPYSLFAMNEGGNPEWIGNVGGRTGIVGNGEITGIRDAIYASSQKEIELLRQQNQLLQGILQKEFGISKNDIGKAAQDYSREYMKRTGNPAYAF